MAKQKKKRNKKYKQKYFTGGRIDMSKGGRVGYQVGGNLDKKQPEPQDKDDMMSIGGPGGGAIQGAADEPVDIGDIGSDTGGANIPPITPPVTPPAETPTETPITSREKAEAASRGEVPQAAIIPEAVPTGIDPETGQPIREQVTTTMAEPTTATAQVAQPVTPETVTTGVVAEAATPEKIQAAKMEAEQVTAEAQVEAAKGEIADEAIAKAAGVERVAPIEGATIDIPEGALTERVVGTLSEGAKAVAAQNAGTSLSRITRAKKQLSRAGLSDTDIEEIGNDPEALEDRLADFSEEQRGIIEGLPQEALVSTQMNKLLEGIEEGEIPLWARPAVASVEQMLAQRGMSASTVGRDSLVNALIQSAMPIAPVSYTHLTLPTICSV